MTERPSAPCPSCGGSERQPFYEARAVPVQSCVLLSTREEAVTFPTGDIALVHCRCCGLIANAAFDSALVDYAASTEESQHFSGTFNSFAARLVDCLDRRYRLADKRVLEIGCGKGDFLRALVERTGASAVGVDPGYIAFAPSDECGGPAFRREYFDPRTIDVPPDLVVCRHTLEHIADVGAFLGKIRSVLDGGRDGTVFFETPDVSRVLSEGAFWDVYYEHCSYFTTGSHADAVERAGLCVDHVELAYDGQYILLHGRRGDTPTVGRGELRDGSELEERVERFPAHVALKQAYWRAFVGERTRNGRRVALWGGGSKAVAFLTTLGLHDDDCMVIDVNPRKQGRYLPGSGHLVRGPDDLVGNCPDTVVVMNPIYVPEVGRMLRDRGLSPELVAL